MRSILFFLAFAQGLSAAEDHYEKWIREDVLHLITDGERTAWRGLATDDDREQFIEQFWMRRDPTPDTDENEFKAEHYRRIVYANDKFASAIPGWKTDRGRIYIQYGPPDRIELRSTEGPARIGTTDGSMRRARTS
jgi:GWxTD domain-containing protein